ncbi:MAG: GTPase HflX [Levilactobacillus sp.]|uniref:GTPase HflX n=1 Tax=Levilactobacillus suantsaiihabitans TaxID=2487722 RepID=A0A4Z0JBJ8_9LACO|nr:MULTISPECIES: GTPase HflX [Levilactobacillus]MCH4123684.1 GTPase HflX [Levilactobacillus sp.]MCI1553782.1 GTPase HflX [Levilactobacillus sp.]MCI1599802.1 GTPase HflX [Levilactobacillus sp.]MCI1605378.1 GTPase HflX [Levilactobacillus sp.]TGD20175.1 GTPase HflX [Levilactobacillus suantsaiihabitans]
MEETPRTPVVTIGLNAGQATFGYSMTELKNLVEANNMTVVEEIQQSLPKPNPGTYFGTGKVEELATIVADDGVDTIVVNDELTPSQIRNLEAGTKARIMDRTGLILEIFANRAQSREAKLQVQLAMLQYQLPRLHTSASQRLDQQTGSGGGGGFTNRGSGESQTEMSRRTIQRSINHVNHELKEINQAAATQRQQRERNELPSVALVGYTNAGKSTLMNALVREFGKSEEKQVFVKNMLFATLDTSVRQLTFPDQKKLLLSDTVGFVSQLPTQLVKAFRSTLAEAANADLLIQVVDYADPNKEAMMATTEQTLEDIGVTDVPMITVFNKADLTDAHYPNRVGDQLILSAMDADSIDALVQAVKEKVFHNYVTANFLIPFADGDVVAYMNDHANVLDTNYEADGTALKVELQSADFDRFKQYVVTE